MMEMRGRVQCGREVPVQCTHRSRYSGQLFDVRFIRHPPAAARLCRGTKRTAVGRYRRSATQHCLPSTLYLERLRCLPLSSFTLHPVPSSEPSHPSTAAHIPVSSTPALPDAPRSTCDLGSHCIFPLTRKMFFASSSAAELIHGGSLERSAESQSGSAAVPPSIGLFHHRFRHHLLHFLLHSTPNSRPSSAGNCQTQVCLPVLHRHLLAMDHRRSDRDGRDEGAGRGRLRPLLLVGLHQQPPASSRRRPSVLSQPSCHLSHHPPLPHLRLLRRLRQRQRLHLPPFVPVTPRLTPPVASPPAAPRVEAAAARGEKRARGLPPLLLSSP